MKPCIKYSLILSTLAIITTTAQAQTPPTIKDISQKTVEAFKHRSTQVQTMYTTCMKSMTDRLTVAGKLTSEKETLIPLICAERVGREYMLYQEGDKKRWDDQNLKEEEKSKLGPAYSKKLIEYYNFKNIDFSNKAWNLMADAVSMIAEIYDNVPTKKDYIDYLNSCIEGDVLDSIPKDILKQQFLAFFTYEAHITLFRCLVETETYFK